MQALWGVRCGVVLYLLRGCVRCSTFADKPHELPSLPLVGFSAANVVPATQALLGVVVLSVCLEDLPGVTSVGDTGNTVFVISSSM